MRQRVQAVGKRIHDAIDHLTELCSSLMSAAVTGKIEVRSPGSSPQWLNPGGYGW